jgi:hypothetical protein
MVLAAVIEAQAPLEVLFSQEKQERMVHHSTDRQVEMEETRILVLADSVGVRTLLSQVLMVTQANYMAGAVAQV